MTKNEAQLTVIEGESGMGESPSGRPETTRAGAVIAAILALREAERRRLHHHVIDALTEDVAELWESCAPWDSRSEDLVHIAVTLAEALHRDRGNIEEVRRALGLA